MCRGFCRGISMFFSICLGKNCRGNLILGNLKNYFSKSKNIYFSLKREKKRFAYFCFSHDFTAQIIYCIIHRYRSFTVLSTDICIFFSYFCCSLISVSKKRRINTNPYLFIQVQRFNKIDEKKKPGVSERGP